MVNCFAITRTFLHMWASEGFFQGGRVDFTRWWLIAFFHGTNSGEFHFTNSKLREKPFLLKRENQIN